MTENYKLINGDMLQELDKLEECSVDCIVTDPPYELGFMGKSWDNAGVSFQSETWKKCLRVLKPGGYLLSFGGTRTYHRIACAIEDAGFEIRDTIMWLYGSGFPKSLNVGLAIDKKNGVESEVVGYADESMPDFQDAGKKNSINKIGINDGESADRKAYPIYRAKNEWNGWGTCLKPAYEPIIVARKPFNGSLVDSVLENGVGGLNIDECRVPISRDDVNMLNAKSSKNPTNNYNQNPTKKYGDYSLNIATPANDIGRFPANVILTYDEDDYDEVCGGMPDTVSSGGSGENSMGALGKTVYNTGWNHSTIGAHLGGLGDSGSASRYFYCAKASKRDRDEGLNEFEVKQTVGGGGGIGDYLNDVNSASGKFGSEKAPHQNYHPTVKPTSLMQYLIKLVAPKGATILDPFMGSGSTGKAVAYENFDRNANYKFIGIEINADYLKIAEARIDYVVKYPAMIDTKPPTNSKNSTTKVHKLF